MALCGWYLYKSTENQALRSLEALGGGKLYKSVNFTNLEARSRTDQLWGITLQETDIALPK